MGYYDDDMRGWSAHELLQLEADWDNLTESEKRNLNNLLTEYGTN
jgi:hypothetical protein